MKKISLIILITIVIGIGLALISAKGNQSLVGFGLLNFNKPVPVSTQPPIPAPNAPKTFNFDSATDLEAELEKINPEVLDSDFE